jgi:hypothetical protein
MAHVSLHLRKPYEGCAYQNANEKTRTGSANMPQASGSNNWTVVQNWCRRKQKRM